LNDIFPDFRDPLFGIIIILIAIFIISSLTYSFGLFKERKTRREYRKLLKRFEIEVLKEDDFVHLYTTYNLPFDSILLLASTFLHKGNYTKAISVYLALLEVVSDNVKKEELLELLGKAYFKGGFLQRAKDIYLKILKFSPRNKTVLNFLLVSYQKLNEYEKAQEILIVLNELGENIKLETVYINTLKILNDSILSYEKKSLEILNIFEHHNQIKRIVAQYLLKYNKLLFWKNIEKFDIKNCIDLLWYLDFNDIEFDIVSKYKLLEDIYSAKGYINNSKNSDIFELSVLISVNNSTVKTQVDINFEYICLSCKKTHPIYESRCPHCHNILTFFVESKLSRKTTVISSFL
jgi:tetratricopeptide (TPR) repeat protein